MKDNHYYEAGINWPNIVPDKTETHVESIPANIFSRELLRPSDTGFVVFHEDTQGQEIFKQWPRVILFADDGLVIKRSIEFQGDTRKTKSLVFITEE